jgi:hypothetical protein
VTCMDGVSGRDKVANCRLRLDLMRACALPPDDSVQVIADLIGER